MLSIKRCKAPALGRYGIELLVFAEGTTWTLDQMLAQTRMNGTAGNETLTSNGYADNMFGLAGNDTLNAGDGDDALTGGAGNDSLAGGNGSDSYFWTKGEGNDTLNDAGTSFVDVDRLVLTNVSSADVSAGTVTLTRASGSSNVLLTIVGSSTEVITLTNQMNGPTNAYGVEVIEFSDGVIWTMVDILDNVKVTGTSAANTLTGTDFRDNLYGLGGNDTLTGANGHDRLVGGAGADSLNGGNGIDTASYRDAAQGVRVDLGIATAQTGNAGGEEVGDILVNIEALEGSAYADILLGDADSNDLKGLAGNDSLSGKDGYDRLYGGDGADTLDGGIGVDLLTGGDGADRFVFTEADFGDDEITDFEDGIDTISFAAAIADDFGDLSISGNGTSEVSVAVGAHTILIRGADRRCPSSGHAWADSMTTLADLDAMGRAALARLWADLMGCEVPANMSQPMQRRFLAFELQARVEGGLSAALLARLERIAAGEERKASPTMKPGARLLRAWNGVMRAGPQIFSVVP